MGKPTHVYVARVKLCGCVVGLATDLEDAETGSNVGEFISSGLIVSREDWTTYREKISKEETFLSCPHGQKRLL